MDDDPYVRRDPAYRDPPRENGWTGYAAVKYGFIFLIVLAVLVFLYLVLRNMDIIG